MGKNPQEKAREIVEKMAVPTAIFKINNQSKRNTKVCIDLIIQSLEDYGRGSDELQNMENEFRYWQEVKKEIEKL